MSVNPKYSTELLIDYVDGLLDPNTEQNIRQVLEKDEKSRAIVAGIHVFYEKHGQDRSKLEEFLESGKKSFSEDEISGGKPQGKVRSILPWVIRLTAAAAVIAVGIFILQPSPSSRELVAEFADEYYALPVTVRGDNLQEEIVKAYVKRDFDRVLALAADAQLDEDPTTDMAVGLSALFEGELEQAEISLLHVTESRSRLTQQANWYLALTYIKAGKKHQAIQLLRDHVRKSDFKKEEARDLLACLETE